MHSIVILIPHFGGWPAWIDFFVESCKMNSDIDWVLLTDSGPLPRNDAPNIRIIPLSFSEYSRLISTSLRIRFCPQDPYKLCDIRPALGEIHADLVEAYDFYGYGDIDVIYGRIRDFYTPNILYLYSALSTHPERVSGHFALLRNIGPIRHAFHRIPQWKELMEEKNYAHLDEDLFFASLKALETSMLGKLRNLRFLFQERYSSPGPTEEMRWYWKNGMLTNEFYGSRGFLYLHFMHWKSSRWYMHRGNVLPGARAPWERLENVIHTDWRRANTDGFMISPRGIEEIDYREFGTCDRPSSSI
jgi:Family of unknown function (DUF6625)